MATAMPPGPRVVGLDGWKHGWIMAEVRLGVLVRVEAVTDLVGALSDLGPLAQIGIDMPFALLPGEREADRLARGRLGRRGSTVFMAPPLSALRAADYPSASATCRRQTGKGLSKQSYNLFPRIREVRAALLSGLPAPLAEIHPELSYLAMTGAPLPRKKSWSGVAHRIRALQAVGLDPLPWLSLPPTVPPDDVLDAIAVAWSAARLASRDPGLIRLPSSAPSDPELHLPAQIVS